MADQLPSPSDLRETALAENLDFIARYPDSGWTQHTQRLGIQRTTDMDLVMLAGGLLHVVDLKRWPADPEMKDLIREAREAVSAVQSRYYEMIFAPEQIPAEEPDTTNPTEGDPA